MLFGVSRWGPEEMTPWVNDGSKSAIKEKSNAAGSPGIAAASANDAIILEQETTNHVQRSEKRFPNKSLD